MKKEERRKKIIEAATTLFSDKGYDGVGMREIAKGANIAVSVLYYYFPNKEVMYKEIFLPFFEEIITGIKQFIELNERLGLLNISLELLKLISEFPENDKKKLKVSISEILGFGKENILREKLTKLYKEHEFVFFYLFEKQFHDKKKSFAASRVLFTYLSAKISDIVLKNNFDLDATKDELEIILNAIN